MAAGLFAPISTENRITGTTRTHRRTARAQLMPSSAYDYGRDAPAPASAWPAAPMADWQAAPPVPDAPPDGQAPIGFQKSVPPTFLRRTLVAPPSPGTPNQAGYADLLPPPSDNPLFANPYAETAKIYAPPAAQAALPPMVEVPPPAEPAYDPWAAMGWRAPEPDPATFENTAVWKPIRLSMFERNAFDDLPDPFHMPQAAGQPYAAPEPLRPDVPAGYGAYPAAAPVPAEEGYGYEAYPPEPGYAADGYAPEPGYAAEGYADEPYPYEGYAPYPGATEDGYGYPPLPGAPYAAAGDPVRHRRATPPPEAQKPSGGSFATIGPWRLALLVGCALALLFCLIEAVKMVQSVWQNEQEMKDYRAQYAQTNGLLSEASGVELLPAGQTYAPTASPVPVNTPTPVPRIDQNDPLIGVMDGGGNTAFQAALPTPTTATRTRLTQYPNNPLLSKAEAFTALRQENPDVVGRLTIDGVLDETVVQRNNTFYLTHNARGTSTAVGAVFVDEGCNLSVPPENLLLRAQANVEGKLFAPLMRYATEGKAFLQQHGIVTCNTIYEEARYVVFAVVRADSRADSADYFNYAGYPTFQSDAQMLRYVQAAKDRSLIPIRVAVSATDRLLTLATVAEGSETTCLVLFCRLLRNGEAPGNIQAE